ncbi:hypothetical protein PMAYCL1PPCAC_24087 [Pristionchus mayeri]|uniref:Uncharacterized protein n=1 Tax=Pristionchus mayeri TaxID=1317129 RepID=A0AAN5I667_9BILA|nr:hypothetical protein PMAYCL1PPCAC_24087 [Pristionchus mayeri]
MDGRPVSFTVSEWQRVQSLFNSDSLEDLKECHIILTAWNHRIPMVAVVCSEMVVATLIGAKLELPPDLAYMKLDTMRRQCAIAVIRFVNYINEMGQPGGIGKPLEMKKAVAPFGVPGWLVEMRHESTHNELPILERLQKGLAVAREWLWENFWARPVHEAMKKAVVTGRDPNEISIEGEGENGVEMMADSASVRRRERLRDLMTEYVEWRGKNVTFEMEKCGMMDRPDILIEIENALLQEPYDLYKVLLSDGFLILSEEQLAAFTAFDPYGAIPPRVQVFWDPMLTMTFENKSIQLFIVELMDRLRDSSSASQTSRAQLITWTKMILDVAFSSNLFSVRDWSSILSTMVALPGIFSRAQMKQVMDQIPELEDKRRRQVHRIMDISIHDEDGNLMEDSMTVKTIDDLKKAIEGDVNKHKGEASAGVWSVSTEKEWRSIPLGMVPSQQFDSFSLIIDDSLLSKWGITPTGPLNWNAVFDEQTASSSSHARDSAHSKDPVNSKDSAPSVNENGEGSGRKRGRGGQVLARRSKLGKRKSREGMEGGEDSFVESMQKRKKKRRKLVVVTID